MTENCEKLFPLGSSDVTVLQDMDDLEIQRHEIEQEDICVEASPVITRRISIDYILTPKKLKTNEDFLRTKLTDEDEVIFISNCTTPKATLGKVKNALPRCPTKVYGNKRAKSEKSWRKLAIGSGSVEARLLTQISPRDGLKLPNITTNKIADSSTSIETSNEVIEIDDDSNSITSQDKKKGPKDGEQSTISLEVSSQIEKENWSSALIDAESSSSLYVPHPDFNCTSLAEVNLRTPKNDSEYLDFRSEVKPEAKHLFLLNGCDKNSLTLSDASPLLWGSSISGVSPLSLSSPDTINGTHQGSRGSPLRALVINEQNNNNTKSTNVFTSTPLSSKMNLEWEELSTVTDGLSECSSSLLPVRKVSREVNSSELIFSEFSQKSNGSDSENVGNESTTGIYANSSQELSGSDKENMDPNSREILPKVKRVRVDNGLDCDCVDYHSKILRSCSNSTNDFHSDDY